MEKKEKRRLLVNLNDLYFELLDLMDKHWNDERTLSEVSEIRKQVVIAIAKVSALP